MLEAVVGDGARVPAHGGCDGAGLHLADVVHVRHQPDPGGAHVLGVTVPCLPNGRSGAADLVCGCRRAGVCGAGVLLSEMPAGRLGSVRAEGVGCAPQNGAARVHGVRSDAGPSRYCRTS